MKITDVLMYSPFTDRYEMMHAAIDLITDECYVDNKIFRMFINKYGNPGVRISAEYRPSKWKQSAMYDYQEESILHAFGYNVSQSKNLSNADRRSILADVVDLEVMTVSQIATFLNFLISTHSDDKFEIARNKWERDYEYITNYKVNPERFLIANSSDM